MLLHRTITSSPKKTRIMTLVLDNIIADWNMRQHSLTYLPQSSSTLSSTRMIQMEQIPFSLP